MVAGASGNTGPTAGDGNTQAGMAVSPAVAAAQASLFGAPAQEAAAQMTTPAQSTHGAQPTPMAAQSSVPLTPYRGVVGDGGTYASHWWPAAIFLPARPEHIAESAQAQR